MARERPPTLDRRLHGRARAAPNEGLGRLDISRPRELIEMGAEVSVGRAREALQPGEVEAVLARIERRQRRHDPQAHGLVDEVVGTVAHDRRIQRPHAMKPKPVTAACHSGKASADHR